MVCTGSSNAINRQRPICRSERRHYRESGQFLTPPLIKLQSMDTKDHRYLPATSSLCGFPSSSSIVPVAVVAVRIQLPGRRIKKLIIRVLLHSSRGVTGGGG